MQDLRYAVRALRKQPGFTFVAVFTLALGIGASTAIFSLLNAVMLRSLPYGDPARLAYLYTPNRAMTEIPKNAIGPASADFYDWQRELHSFSPIAIFDQASFNLAVHGATSQAALPPQAPARSDRSGRSDRSAQVATLAAARADRRPDLETAATASGAGASAQRVEGARVSGEFFATLAVQTAFGRTIGPEDDRPGRERVVVISHALWQSAFGGDAAVLGRSLALDAQTYQVIGVMPPAFRYPRSSDLGDHDDVATDVWLPLALTPAQRADRGFSNHTAIGRLHPGVSFAQAQAELSTLMTRLDALHPAELRGWYAFVLPSLDAAVGGARSLLWLLLGAVSLVLLIACSNAAHLLLARAAGRAHEFGVRSALGAGRGRLIAQALAESLLLAAGGGLLGIALAMGAIRGLLRLDPGNIPRLQETSLDLRVLIFCVALSIVTGLLFGLFPALAVARVEVGDLLRQGGQQRTTTTSNRLRRGLILAQIGLAVVLLAGAGLLLRSYDRLRRVDIGFSSSAMITRVVLDARYTDGRQRLDLYRRLLDRLRAAPGVQQVAAVDALPLSHSERAGFFEVEGYANMPGQIVHQRSATPGYFDAMGTPLLEGRGFTEADVAGRPGGPPGPPGVLIVNQSFVKTYLGDRPPLGRRLRFASSSAGSSTESGAESSTESSTRSSPESAPRSSPGSGPRSSPGSRPQSSAVPWLTIVGVVADVRHTTLEDAALPQVYESFWQSDANRAYVVVRSARSVAETTGLLRQALSAVDPLLAIGEVRPMDALVSEAGGARRFQTMLLGLFAAVALVLAAIGLYGLMAYTTKQRAPEIGIRLALGAQRRDVVALVLGQGLRLTAIGLAIGFAAALLLTRLLRGWLYEVAPHDPLVFGGAAIVLAAAALLACAVPARRAARAEPLVALRHD